MKLTIGTFSLMLLLVAVVLLVIFGWVLMQKIITSTVNVIEVPTNEGNVTCIGYAKGVVGGIDCDWK